VFSINCYQQGDRLKNARLKGMQEFVSSAFSMILMTQDGKFIAGSHSGEYSFVATMLLKEGTIKKGDYLLRIDPRFMGSTDKPEYKRVLVDIYST
jgi:hypothetical protein